MGFFLIPLRYQISVINFYRASTTRTNPMSLTAVMFSDTMISPNKPNKLLPRPLLALSLLRHLHHLNPLFLNLPLHLSPLLLPLKVKVNSKAKVVLLQQDITVIPPLLYRHITINLSHTKTRITTLRRMLWVVHITRVTV